MGPHARRRERPCRPCVCGQRVPVCGPLGTVMGALPSGLLGLAREEPFAAHRKGMWGAAQTLSEGGRGGPGVRRGRLLQEWASHSLVSL